MAQPRDCPRCKLVNPPSAVRCDCGYDFVSRRVLGTYLTDKDLDRLADDARADAQHRRLVWSMFRFFGRLG